MNPSSRHSSFYYPPGGILIWVIIVVELITFLGGLTAFSVYKAHHPAVARAAGAHISALTGTINTLVLITGGFFMAYGLTALQKSDARKAARFTLLAVISGIVFLVVKSVEYRLKFDAGIGLSGNMFFTYYFLITGFHYIHVLLAVIILSVLYISIKKGKYDGENYLDVATGAAFWHLCDVIWMMVFPVFYLL